MLVSWDCQDSRGLVIRRVAIDYKFSLGEGDSNTNANSLGERPRWVQSLGGLVILYVAQGYCRLVSWFNEV